MAQIGIIKSKVNVSDLQLIEDEPKLKRDGKEHKLSAVRVSVSRDFRGEIDLRGKTGDEAWSVVDKYFDDAAIAGFHSVRLIHGKGTGALKNALWTYLKRDSRVASFRIGQFGEGDGGVTVVELK
jgi:DNA mismatch repair protein MutS2